MLDSDRIASGLKKKGIKKVFVQFPEGLKLSVQDLCQRIEKLGITTYLSAEPCYGACDMRDGEAGPLRCDALLHIGHTKNPSVSSPKVQVIYEEFRTKANPLPFLKKSMSSLSGYKRISLYTSIQYIDCLEKTQAFLESAGKQVFLSKSKKAQYPGQALGCDRLDKSLDSKTDCHLFIGTGRFHPLGLAMQTSKPFLFLDLETGRIESLDEERNRMETSRMLMIEKAKGANNFGILVSTKPGQFSPGLAEKAKALLEKKGKRAWILIFDEITPQKLLGLKLDCLVNCACPRLQEDFRLFKKPVLNPDDLKRL